MRRSRRAVLASGSTFLATFGGCAAGSEATPSSERRSTPTAESTEQAATSRPAADRLPQSGDGWTREEPEEAWVMGCNGGARATYRSPEGTRFDAVVFLFTGDNGGSAAGWGRSLACAGWDAVVAHESVLYAASSGTRQKEYTPEKPPQMDRTAVPETAETARKLLTRSPALTQSEGSENEVDPTDC